MKKINKEVFYNTDKIFILKKKIIQKIKKLTDKNKSKKFRICVHKSPKDTVHEMIVVHSNKTYVRPHMHTSKSESLYVIEGKATVIVFDKKGKVIRSWKIGDINSGLPFYYKMEKNIIHTFIFHTKYFIFKETTKGPFKKNITSFPNWAPKNNNENLGLKYIRDLKINL
jgi:cupin fold WbuC family metalloprotein